MLGDLFELIRHAGWLQSCGNLGHAPGQVGAGTGTAEGARFMGPVSCLRCGAVLENVSE